MTTGNKYEKKISKENPPVLIISKALLLTKHLVTCVGIREGLISQVIFEQGAKGVTHVVIWEDFYAEGTLCKGIEARAFPKCSKSRGWSGARHREKDRPGVHVRGPVQPYRALVKGASPGLKQSKVLTSISRVE